MSIQITDGGNYIQVVKDGKYSSIQKTGIDQVQLQGDEVVIIGISGRATIIPYADVTVPVTANSLLLFQAIEAMQ